MRKFLKSDLLVLKPFGTKLLVRLLLLLLILRIIPGSNLTLFCKFHLELGLTWNHRIFTKIQESKGKVTIVDSLY